MKKKQYTRAVGLYETIQDLTLDDRVR